MVPWRPDFSAAILFASFSSTLSPQEHQGADHGCGRLGHCGRDLDASLSDQDLPISSVLLGAQRFVLVGPRLFRCLGRPPPMSSVFGRTECRPAYFFEECGRLPMNFSGLCAFQCRAQKCPDLRAREATPLSAPRLQSPLGVFVKPQGVFSRSITGGFARYAVGFGLRFAFAIFAD